MTTPTPGPGGQPPYQPGYPPANAYSYGPNPAELRRKASNARARALVSWGIAAVLLALRIASAATLGHSNYAANDPARAAGAVIGSFLIPGVIAFVGFLAHRTYKRLTAQAEQLEAAEWYAQYTGQQQYPAQQYPAQHYPAQPYYPQQTNPQQQYPAQPPYYPPQQYPPQS